MTQTLDRKKSGTIAKFHETLLNCAVKVKILYLKGGIPNSVINVLPLTLSLSLMGRGEGEGDIVRK